MALSAGWRLSGPWQPTPPSFCLTSLPRALDAQNTKEVLALLDEIARDGKLVIAVTHSQEVADNGTRIVHLADGKIDGDERLRPAYPIPEDPTEITPRVLPAMAS